MSELDEIRHDVDDIIKQINFIDGWVLKMFLGNRYINGETIAEDNEKILKECIEYPSLMWDATLCLICIEFCDLDGRCTGVRNVILGKYDSWYGCDIIPRKVRDIFGDEICSDNELNSYGYEGSDSKYYRCPPLYDRAKKLKDKIDRYKGVKSSHDDKRVFLEMQVLTGVKIIKYIGKNLGFDVEKFRNNVESYIEYGDNLAERLDREMVSCWSVDEDGNFLDGGGDCDTKYFERKIARVNHVTNCFRQLLKEKENIGFTKKALVSDKKPSKSTTKKSASKSTKTSSTSKSKTASKSESSAVTKTSKKASTGEVKADNSGMDFFIRAMLEKVGGTGVLLGTDVYMVKGKQRDESLVEDAQDLLGRAISELSIAYSEASKGSSDITARIDSVIELLLNARK